MATELITPNAITMADFKGRVEPDWCPGCGDYGVLAAVQKALVELQIPQHEVATISGIGCSSNFPGFIETYGMHTLHGRSLPVATGVKMANHALTVLVTGGDGDGFGIGCGHFVHAMRRNVDLTYLVMDNQIYGLTTGQTSPTSRLGMKTKSAPFGNVERPVNPVALALAAGATYVARGFSADPKHLTDTPAYDPTDWTAAMEQSQLWGDEIPIGKFFERTDVPTLHSLEPVLNSGPLVHQDNRIPADVAKSFIDELM